MVWQSIIIMTNAQSTEKKITQFTPKLSWYKTTDFRWVNCYLYHRNIRNNAYTKCLSQNSPDLSIRKVLGDYNFQLYNPTTMPMLFLPSITDMLCKPPIVTKVNMHSFKNNIQIKLSKTAFLSHPLDFDGISQLYGKSLLVR